MKSLALLLCFVQLCQSAPHGAGLGYRELPCDDPETEQVALAAVNYLNGNLNQGYKHILNQIDKAKVWSRRPTGQVYELEIDTLETTCHALDPTPLANCSVRQLTEHAVEGDCDFSVLKQDGKLFVLFSKCHSTPDSAEDVRKVCPDCPLLAPLNDTRVVHAVDAALTAFNAQTNGSYYKLVEISRAQIVPVPVSTTVEFAVAVTDCTAKEVTDPAKCNLLAEKQYGFCKATLLERLGGEEIGVTCKVFQAQPQPEGANPTDAAPAVEPAVPEAPPANPPAASLAVGPMVVAVPPKPPVHRAHYDLRHAFVGGASGESGSSEAFRPPKGAHHSAGGATGPAIRQCPGKIRYFKI